MKKKLCLDIGNVLCLVDFSNFNNLLSSKLNLSKDEVWGFLSRVQKLHDLGLTDLRDELRDHFKVKSDVIIGEILSSWNSVLIPNNSVISKIEYLVKKLDCEIALLSNIGFEHAALFNQKVGFNDAIKHFSCLVGARKPSMLYFQSFLLEHPSFKGAVYIDDNRDNLAAGNKMGFKSIYFNLEDYARDSITTDILLADTLEKLITTSFEEENYEH